jgi:hypothetical protein
MSKPTPRVATFLLLFVPALFAGDRLIAAACARLVGMSHDRYVDVYEGRAAADILVIGNSRADNHFPPQLMGQLLGRKVVNLGLGGVSTVLAEALVADYIEKNGPPKLIVIEPSCLIVEPAAIGDMRLFSIYSKRIHGLIRRYMPEFHYAAEVFHAFNFNNEMFLRVLNQIRSIPEDRVHFTSITPELLQVIRAEGRFPLVDYPDNEVALTRLLDYIRGQHIALRVVITPYLPDHLANLENFPVWRTHLFELGVRREDFFDYSDRFNRPDYFRDGVHMNTEGTKKLLGVMMDEGFYAAVREPEGGVPIGRP